MSDSFVSTRTVDRDDLTGRIFEGVGASRTYGVLVLHGSGGGGGYEQEYARRVARHGYTAFCVEYFGSPGTPEALAEIPLSYFDRAIEWLTDQPEVESDRVGVVGFSRGGEVALLVGSYLDRVGTVVGYVPSGYVFPAPTWMSGVEEEGPAWTFEGEPIPYIPVDPVVESDQSGLDAALRTDEHASSIALDHATPAEIERATIPVERIDGPVLLVSGGKDTIWSSSDLADVAIERLTDHGHSWSYDHRSYPAAGHAIRTPYRFDATDDPAAEHSLGGTYGANARASADAWLATLDYLRRGLRNRTDGTGDSTA